MDYKSENCGANIIKCMDWCINHDACKNCEMRTDAPIVLTISEWKSTTFKIATNDSRGSEVNVAGIEKDDLVDVLYYVTHRLNNKGYSVLFEINNKV